MISEDHVTQDWSNDAENTALITEINYILTYIHTEHSYFKIKYFFTILLFLLYFCSHNRRAEETSFRNIKRLLKCIFCQELLQPSDT